jgi:hypothetical protein
MNPSEATTATAAANLKAFFMVSPGVEAMLSMHLAHRDEANGPEKRGHLTQTA